MKSDSYSNLKQQWDHKLPFVLYSLPYQKQCTAYLQNDDRLLTDVQLQKTGFVFGGFDMENQLYIIEGDNELVLDEFTYNEDAVEFSISDQGDKKSHISTVQKAVEHIKNSALEKVVIARSVTAHLKGHPLAVYSKLYHKYPNAFTYCFYHPMIGLWFGASPELLVSTTNSNFKTVSLAGTRWAELSDSWGTKEIEEQQLVTTYIKSRLDDLDLSYQYTDVQTIKAGHLLHLKQEFKGELKSSKLIDLIKALHPTPAVCGLPTSVANSFITVNENLDRSFYAGFMGPISHENQNAINTSYLGVNIRCMQVVDDCALLYVGGGITADSDPELEWEETVKKSQILTTVFD